MNIGGEMDDVYHSGLESVDEANQRIKREWEERAQAWLKPIKRKFLQVSVTVDPNSGDVYRNAVCSDGYVWMWVVDDWVPLPSCPQDEVKV